MMIDFFVVNDDNCRKILVLGKYGKLCLFTINSI